MYGKIFESMYDGTLASKGPWQALVTFQQMIVLADQDGVVDMTAHAIARRTSIPLEIIETGLVELMKPDPDSRTPDDEGRRIITVEAHRNWGWQIVNHAKYRDMRKAEDRREYLRLAQAKRREGLKSTSVNTRQQLSAHVSTSTHTDTDASSEAEALNTATSNDVARARPSADHRLTACPHMEILGLWAEVLPSMPQHDPEQWRAARADNLRARWRETAQSKHWPDQVAGLAYFRKLFAYVGQSQFLTGRAQTRDGRRPFIAELEWLVKPMNWAKLIEGKYHSEEA